MHGIARSCDKQIWMRRRGAAPMCVSTEIPRELDALVRASIVHSATMTGLGFSPLGGGAKWFEG